MWIENISYIVTFLISCGMTVIGILLSYQLQQTKKQAPYSALLYQQIFLFSFLIYSIWGNVALRILIGDFMLNEALYSRLAMFIPIIGIPFMIVSWFMLLKFSLVINNYPISNLFIYSFFSFFIILTISLAFLIHHDIIGSNGNADLFIVRVLTGINLVVHFVFLFPFLLRTKNTPSKKESGFEKKYAMLYLLIVFVYSLTLFYFNLFHFISTCISVILLFAGSAVVPAIIRLNVSSEEESININFDDFCRSYEISPREAEIILEICSGKSNKAISEKLFITLQTVKDHNHRIFTKTGVKSRVQLANLVREKTGSENNS